ncbi:MAG TPA: hypothetical protein VHW00_17195 [Thermoanaerobaculia bacterium]|nr:hypothetical protein [Thermoanaerobaculia bacterium]
MTEETVYSSAAMLTRPREFVRDAIDDLRHSPSVAWRLFRSNLQARHRRAWLGYLWLLLPTLATTFVWVYVASRRVVTIAPTVLPYAVHVLVGMVLWQVFVDALQAPLQQLSSGRDLVTRSRVPHEAVMLAGLFETMLNCAVRLLIAAAAVLLFRVPIAATAFLIPLGIVALALLGFALGVLIAPLGLLYDDVGRSLALVTTFWFFLTPVIYPAPDAGLLALNPVTPLLDQTRAWLTESRFSPAFVVVTLAAAFLLVAAWLLQRVTRVHVVARLG